MNISLRWLQDFLRRPLDSKDVRQRLTMLGAPVDAVEPVNPGLENLVVARVLEVSAHPNPKFTKVRMTLVDDGTGEPKAVACGAQSVGGKRRNLGARDRCRAGHAVAAGAPHQRPSSRG